MAAGGFDGSINIDTRIDSAGFNRGIKNIGNGLDGIKSSLKGLAAAVGVAFGVAAVINFGKESVKASTNLSNAMLGLRSIIQGQGRDYANAQAFLQKYISDGLIPATNAVTAYKNLASRGYTDPQIQSTLQALKDSAAFGRQATLTMGEAVQSATEGLKNENSILVDNAGVTKNVSMMWADYAASIGVGVQSLTKQQKIQAEVTGIMQETRFQTGDAAKLANTYSGEVLKLGYNFNNLKIAIGNALIPMAQAVLPSINAIINGLTRVANLFAQVTTALFGRQAAQQQAVANTASSIASSSNDAAKAQNKLADATKKAGKAAENNVATWDDLTVLQQDASSNSADQNTPNVPAGTGAIGGEQELGAGVTVSPSIQAAADTIKGVFADIDKALGPTKEALSVLWSEFQRLGTFSWAALQDFYSSFLVPVGKWTLGVGLPDFITALKDGMAKIDWGKINVSLKGLWDALAPFAINVGQGLLWFWTNVLVPLGTWTMNNVVPLFLDLLANAIDSVNSVINALEPLGLWLFDNFLKPIAAWTGGIIVSVLTTLRDALGKISDWISQNQGIVQGMAVTVGLFFAAWKISDLLIFITDAGGIVGALTNITNAVKAGTAAKLADRIELMQVVASYAKDFIVSVAQSTAALVTNSAQWVAATAVKVADTVAQWAATAAVTAWEAICGVATAATTAFSTAMAFLAANPIVLVIAAIAAVIAIIVLMITHWDQVKAVAINCWNAICAAWKVVATWFNTNVVQPVSKFFGDLWTGISGAAGKAWEAISGVWKTVSGWFHDYVISPIETAFKASINFLIGLVEGFVNSFIDGVNVVIGLLNNFHVDIPDWDIFGDMRGQTFGLNIPRVNRLSIPRLATGAVIPPRAEFAAILGDQRTGRNIEAPESLIRGIVSDELSKIDFKPQVNVIASGDNAGLVKWMKFEIEHEGWRIGQSMGTGGGR